ncbi:hypothetical protein B5E84_01360 [Lachnoclostridium sp. An14]|nr:hypothetical protein B5E84_01360 [Lachnoclostridium sp. An14]
MRNRQSYRLPAEIVRKIILIFTNNLFAFQETFAIIQSRSLPDRFLIPGTFLKVPEEVRMHVQPDSEGNYTIFI